MKQLLQKSFLALLLSAYVANALAGNELLISFDEPPTGVESVSGSKFLRLAKRQSRLQVSGKDEMYNLSGQRVGEDYKGIVIKNGKKLVY